MDFNVIPTAGNVVGNGFGIDRNAATASSLNLAKLAEVYRHLGQRFGVVQERSEMCVIAPYFAYFDLGFQGTEINRDLRSNPNDGRDAMARGLKLEGGDGYKRMLDMYTLVGIPNLDGDTSFSTFTTGNAATAADCSRPYATAATGTAFTDAAAFRTGSAAFPSTDDCQMVYAFPKHAVKGYAPEGVPGEMELELEMYPSPDILERDHHPRQLAH